MAAFVYPPSMPMNGGLPNKISNGLRFGFTLFLILMYISTIGRALSQVRPVSSQHFANLFLIVWFCLSTAPPDEGAYPAVSSHVNSQELTHLLYRIIDKVSAIIRTDFSGNSPPRNDLG